MRAAADDLALLARAFHADVEVHEPRSLPYAGDWWGRAGVGALFRKKREVWSDLSVEGMEAGREGDTVFMTCTLSLTSRANGHQITQPFAEVPRFRDDLLIDATPSTTTRGRSWRLSARQGGAPEPRVACGSAPV